LRKGKIRTEDFQKGGRDGQLGRVIEKKDERGDFLRGPVYGETLVKKEQNQI